MCCSHYNCRRKKRARPHIASTPCYILVVGTSLRGYRPHRRRDSLEDGRRIFTGERNPVFAACHNPVFYASRMQSWWSRILHSMLKHAQSHPSMSILCTKEHLDHVILRPENVKWRFAGPETPGGWSHTLSVRVVSSSAPK